MTVMLYSEQCQVARHDVTPKMACLHNESLTLTAAIMKGYYS